MQEERQRSGRLRAVLPLVCAVAAASCGSATGSLDPGEPGPMPPGHGIVPVPFSIELAEGDSFAITTATRIVVDPGSTEAAGIGEYLAGILRPSTGFAVPVSTSDGTTPHSSIALRIAGEETALGEEGYELAIAEDSVTLTANQPAGLFLGIQTLRQLLPAAVEGAVVHPGPWTIPTGRIVDRPRFAWRGAMLDVARHFFTVDEVKRYIDLISLYKINRLHLHLADDQGWRIMIRSRPRLATYGGATEVGGTPGGFYTQEEYAEIVEYARDRYITVVPEIDMPGHTNAALASYAELNCNGTAPPRYTGIKVGFSSLCVDREATYKFVDDVVREIAALTPGPYIHIGGDEVETLSQEDYAKFIERVQGIVNAYGKRMVGWEEVAQADLFPTSIVQQWRSDSAQAAIRQGAKLIMSPASRAYLDMKYDPNTELGLKWAGFVDVRDAYEWDPVTFMEGVTESDVLGVEAPVWSETLRNMGAVEFMAFPRLPAIAEIGWSPAEKTDWEHFRLRLAAQAPRWNFMGANYHRSPQIPWPD